MSEAVWSAVLDMIPDVGTWNANIGEFKRLTEQYGEPCRAFIKAEAERRGYLYSKTAHEYVHLWRMIACKHPGRLIGVGFKSGQLAAVFASKNGPVRYESAAKDVPVETADKLVNSLYPDALYKKLVKDKGITMERIG